MPVFPRRAIVIFIVLLGIIIFINEYTKKNDPFPSISPIQNEAVLENYPDLFQTVENRNADALLEFTNHEQEIVRDQAWRGLASTPVEDVSALLEIVLEQDNQLPWFALSMHNLPEESLRTLEQRWDENENNRSNISLVLGRQGDEETLSFLLSRLDEAAQSNYEYDFALALGRLMIDYPVDSEQQRSILRQAFEASEHETIRAYLYGFYRGNTQELDEQTERELYQLWADFGLGASEIVDQYMVQIIPDRTLYEIGQYYNSENLLDDEIQIAIELAEAIEKPELDRRQTLIASFLLRHENPHVAYQTLQSLRNNIREGENHLSYLRNDFLPDDSMEPYVWTQGLKMAATIDTSLIEEHRHRLNQIEQEHPYLLTKILEIYQIDESARDFLERISEIIRDQDPLAATSAMEGLETFVEEQEEGVLSENRDQIREIVFDALDLNDRAVSYQATNLLENDDLFEEEDFSTIHKTLSGFELPADLEVFQAFGSLYRDHFEDQAQSVIDSLANLENPALNRSLAEAGWDVDVPEEEPSDFREPNWETFPEVGENPTWVVETNRGEIKVEVFTLTAPATVSAIDSLTRAGAYNGIAFHRIVPNFVIQGGDIKREDGLGGADFRLPTEASEREFNRGAAGMASAGTDTEGSQYFFMHQWKPHLNGSYTLFGKVIEGMSVVDEIVPGDSVRTAEWE